MRKRKAKTREAQAEQAATEVAETSGIDALAAQLATYLPPEQIERVRGAYAVGAHAHASRVARMKAHRAGIRACVAEDSRIPLRSIRATSPFYAYAIRANARAAVHAPPAVGKPCVDSRRASACVISRGAAGCLCQGAVG